MAAKKVGAKGKPRTQAKGKAPAARKSSAPSTRARGMPAAKTTRKAPPKTKPKTARAKAAKQPPAALEPALPSTLPHLNANGHPGAGRPKDSPDVWTPEHIEEVADLMWNYIQATPCPAVCEFCSTYGIRHQRLGEFPALAEMREFLQAKRATYIDREGRNLSKEDGPKGPFLQKMAANCGPYSMVDKSEVTERVQSVNVYVPDNGRGDGPKAGEHG